MKRALSYPLKLIAKNAGVNGSVVVEKVLSNGDYKFGYNAATGSYEDLMAAGIIDPAKVGVLFGLWIHFLLYVIDLIDLFNDALTKLFQTCRL